MGQGTREDYQPAEQFLPGNLQHRVHVADVTAHWIEKKNRFWYRKARTKRSEFLFVDAEKNSAGPAFDHERLATSLSKALKRTISSSELPFESIEFSADEKSISFQVDGTSCSCQLEITNTEEGRNWLPGRTRKLPQ